MAMQNQKTEIKLENFVKEVKRLSEWQTKYFERFVDYSQLIDEMDGNLKIEISGKKIAIHGEKRNSVDEAYEKIDQIIDSIERKELEIEPRSLIKYFISTDLSKLNQLVEENGLKVMLNKSDESIQMIGTRESSFEELKQLISSRFSTKEYIIDRSLTGLIRSRKFEESVEKKRIELSIPEKEIKIDYVDHGISCTGEKHLVDEILIHVNKFMEENKILSYDFTNRYSLETLKFFERVIYYDLERELNKNFVYEDFQMKQVIHLNSSDNIPQLCINIPNKYSHLIDEYLEIFDRFAFYMMVDDYSIHTLLPLCELFENELILEEIMSIEKRTRCLIFYTEEKIITNSTQLPNENVDLCSLELTESELLDPISFDHINSVESSLDQCAQSQLDSRKTEMNERILKFSIRSYNVLLIETCRIELNQMVENLNKLIKSQQLFDESFNRSNQTLIQDVESLFPKSKISYQWDFKNHTISIFGKSENISTTLNEIFKLTNDFNKSKQAEYYLRLISEIVQWQMFRRGEWIAFSEFLNARLEMKYDSLKDKNDIKTIRLLDEQSCFFVVDLKTNTLSYDNDLGLTHYEIRRVDLRKTSLLKDALWTSTKDIDLVRLEPNKELYNEILGVFVSMGLTYKKILSIERIENRYLYTQFISEKEFLLSKYSLGSQIEYNLFHGTSGDSVENISKSGFNRSYAGKNATAFGRGVYFARFASYSHNYTDIKRGTKRGRRIGHMFLCRVLVGTYTLGDSSMTVAPHNFDSTTDNSNNPSMYVIYKDAQAYPDYLMTYE